MSENIGTARADLTIDTRDYELSLERAKGKTVGFSEAAQNAYRTLEGRQKTATDRLLAYVASLERSTDARRLLTAAENDVPKEIWSEAAARIQAYNNAVLVAEAETRGLAAAMEEAARWNAEFDKHRAQGADNSDAQAAQQAWRRAEATEALTLALYRQESAEEMLANMDAVRAEEEKARLAWRRSEATDALTLALYREDAAEEALAGQADFERQQRAAQQAWRRAEATEALTVALQNQEKAEQNTRWIQGLQRQTQVLGMSTAELLEFEAAERGVTAQAAPLIAAFKAKEAAIRAESGALMQGKKWNDQYNMSQKQVEFAMRGLPAQITDIFVSLQGGQAPLTVLLQQGGQLKDMFGGIGNAARVLGGELIKLASNPYVLVAAAVGAVGAAYLSSEQRANAFNKALIMSGQAGTVTADELDRIAMALDDIGGITQGGASKALAEIASSGKIAASQYALVAEAAERMRDAVGKATAETVQEYAEMARDPYGALLKFNEAENFLTQSIADRVRQMQEAGDIEGALALATETRAAAQIERSQQVIENLGLVSGAWHEIKKATTEAWDEASSYFTNLDRDAKGATETLTAFFRSWNTAGPAGAFGMQAALTSQASTATKRAAEETKTVNSEIQRQLDAITAGNRTREEAQELEEKRIRNLGKAANLSAKEIEDLITKSRKAYEASKPKGRKGDGEANALQQEALAAMRNQFKEQQAELRAQNEQLQMAYNERAITARDYYTGLIDLRNKEFASLEQSTHAQIAYLQGQKDSAKNRKEIGDLESELAQKRIENETAVAKIQSDQRIYEKRRAESLLDYQRALEASENALMRQNQAQLQAMGVSAREAEMIAKITDLYFKQADELQKLEDQKRRDGQDDAWLREREDLLRASTERQVQIVRDGYDAMSSARMDWRSAWNASVAELMDESQNLAGETREAFNIVTGGLVNAFQNLRKTGKAAIDDISGALADMVLEVGTNKILAWLLGYFGGGAAGVGPVQPEAITFNAKGNVYKSQSLSSMSGQVRDTPTMFAKGGAVLGEAGPEAIMPLSRDSSGRLGIQAAGGAGGEPPNINVSIYGAPGEAQVSAQRGTDGNLNIEVLLGKVDEYMAGSVMNGTSKTGTALKRKFALREG